MTFALQTVLGPGEVLPTAFEASEKWPNLIHGPLDQGNCAGSWAFSTAGMSKGGGWGSRKGGPRPEPPDGPSASPPSPTSRGIRSRLNPFPGAYGTCPVAPEPAVL